MNRALRLAAVAAALASGCASEPCPRDEVLLERFGAREASFEKLAKDPDGAALRSELGILGVQRPGDGLLHFAAWRLDFPGAGGAVKGYAYAEKEPAPLVESLDASSSPGSPEEKLLYRRIEANWYLFYAASN